MGQTKSLWTSSASKGEQKDRQTLDHQTPPVQSSLIQPPSSSGLIRIETSCHSQSTDFSRWSFFSIQPRTGCFVCWSEEFTKPESRKPLSISEILNHNERHSSNQCKIWKTLVETVGNETQKTKGWETPASSRCASESHTQWKILEALRGGERRSVVINNKLIPLSNIWRVQWMVLLNVCLAKCYGALKPDRLIQKTADYCQQPCKGHRCISRWSRRAQSLVQHLEHW